MRRVYDVGDRPNATVTFSASSGPVDPTTVTCTIRKPDRTRRVLVFVDDEELVRTSPGIYSVALDLDQPGRWTVAFEATGLLVAAAEDHFQVRDPER